MIDAIKKVMLAGVGAAVVTAEKVEDALADWVERGKISAEEARGVAQKVASQSKEEFETASRDVKKAVQDLLDRTGVGQKDRIDALEKRLLALEIEVANLNTRVHGDVSR